MNNSITIKQYTDIPLLKSAVNELNTDIKNNPGSIPNCLLHFKKKAVIPEYMGKWLESAKREGYNIRGAIEQAPKGRIEDWLELENVDIFMKGSGDQPSNLKTI